MKANVTPLRQRQAEQVREVVLDAAIAQLEARSVDDVSMADVAQSAGVSLRTLYRYFPDRASLLSAAGEHLYRSLGIPFDIAAPEDIAPSFREAARRLGTRPALARALVQSRAGRATRSVVRSQRVRAVRTALEPLTADLEPDTARWATAVIAHLCSAASWVTIADESGLSDADAQQAVSWGIEALIDRLRQSARHRHRPSHR